LAERAFNGVWLILVANKLISIANAAICQLPGSTAAFGACLVALTGLTALPLAARPPRPQPAPPARDTGPLGYAA